MEREKNLTAFNEALNAFYSSRLIIVDKVISDFLKVLAQDASYMEILADSARTINFQQEFQKALTSTENGLAFRLPQSKRHIISLVTGLLFEFDKKNISVIEFVRRFFPDEVSHNSYIAFCDEIIKPFGVAFTSVYLGDTEDSISSKSITDLASNPISEKSIEEINYWLSLIIEGVISDNSFEPRHRDDSITLVKGMMYVITLQNPLLIKLNWIGLRYTLGIRNSFFRELKEVEAILMTYGVID